MTSAKMPEALAELNAHVRRIHRETGERIEIADVQPHVYLMDDGFHCRLKVRTECGREFEICAPFPMLELMDDGKMFSA